MTRAFLSRFLRDSSAAAAAEMALAMPILFALMFTTFEGGNYMWTEHKVVKAVRDGARYAGRLSFDYYDCDSATILDAARETEIKNLTRTGQISGGTPKVKDWADDDITVTVECEDDLAYQNGLYSTFADGVPHVTVSTVVPYPSLLGLLGFDTSGLGVRAQANAPVTGL